MQKFSKIIFIDEENTRLGPVTCALFKKKARAAGLDKYDILSRGTVVLFPEPVDKKIVEIGKSYDIDLTSYSARAIEEKDFGKENLVLSLDSGSKKKVYDRFPSAENVYTLKEYLGSSGDIKPPLGGTIEDYQTVMNIVGGLLDSLIKKLQEED